MSYSWILNKKPIEEQTSLRVYKILDIVVTVFKKKGKKNNAFNRKHEDIFMIWDKDFLNRTPKELTIKELYCFKIEDFHLSKYT